MAGDTYLRRQRRGGEQALDIAADCGVRVGDGGGFQRRLGQAGSLGGLVPEAGVGEEAGSALGVVDDRDLEEPLSGDYAAEQLPGEEGQVGDVIDDGLGDAPARVADDDGVAELES